MKPDAKMPAGSTVMVAIHVVISLLIAVVLSCNKTAKPPSFMGREIKDHGTYLVSLPDKPIPSETYPLVFALSPHADASAMVSTWSRVADRHRWIVAASKEFHNGQEFNASLRQIAAELEDVENKYPIDRNRVIFTGISGGGMGAHAFSQAFPGRVSAIVINTGMMAKTLMASDYPRGKLAVFLASPTDFRYTEMQRDRNFLEIHGWKTKWIEFSGGHTLAPAAVYDQAADWLEENLP